MRVVRVGGTIDGSTYTCLFFLFFFNAMVFTDFLHRGTSLPAGLQHRFVVVPEDRKLAVMARQMRTDLRECVILMVFMCF